MAWSRTCAPLGLRKRLGSLGGMAVEALRRQLALIGNRAAISTLQRWLDALREPAGDLQRPINPRVAHFLNV